MRPRSPSSITSAMGIGLAGLLLGAAAHGQQTGPAPASKGELVGPGYLRVHREERMRLTEQQIEQFLAAGKHPRLDPATGEMITSTFTDALPAGWRLEQAGDAPAGVRTDSLGNPIVNDAPGLPAWAQRDVDALRAAIVQWRDAASRARMEGRAASEADAVLGNFIGQAIVRGINIDDLADIDDPRLVGPGVADSILGYLHFYENVRFANQGLFGYQYAPTVYPARIAAFAARHGADLDALQALEPMDANGPRGDSGCYARNTFARGISSLVGQTDIWAANGADDQAADISTGFPLFFFYDCQDADNNDTVRVSTNGYLSFFQQGGGATFGTSFGNDAIPTADDPDGLIAPWWDDLFVATSQGTADRVSYKTEGEVDQRVFTVEWFSVSRLGGSTDEFHFFQVKLYETSDVVELHYGLNIAGWMTDALDSATIGMENYSGDAGDCGPNCLATNNPPPPNNYRFTPSPRPVNDNCAAATPLVNGSSITGNLHRATPDGAATCGSSSNNRDEWYTFTARCDGVLRVDTCGSRDIAGVNTGIDTVLSVHSACPGTPANQLACSDDAGGVGCSPNDSAVAIPVSAGQQVFIRVTHFGDLALRFASGRYILHANLDATSPPSNNNCAGAITVVSGTNVGGNLLCANNDGSSDCGASATNPDIWYRFTAPYTGRLTVDTCGSRDNAGADTGPDTVLSIHSGCPGTTANQIACNDDAGVVGCDVLDARALANLTAGQQVRIRVSHFGSNESRVRNGLIRLRTNFSCLADFNRDATINSQDFFDFLTAFFAGQAAADINLDNVINSQDFFDFLTRFFSGC